MQEGQRVDNSSVRAAGLAAHTLGRYDAAHGEPRWQTMGPIARGLVVVVWTEATSSPGGLDAPSFSGTRLSR